MDRLVEAQSDTAVTANERRITKLEKDKLIKAEELEKNLCQKGLFEEVFKLALNFLANPGKIWACDRIEGKQTVLKLILEEECALPKGASILKHHLTNGYPRGYQYGKV